MKRALHGIGAIIFLNCFIAIAQAPDWTWARNAEGPGLDTGEDIATDGSGNVFVTGLFFSPFLVFGTDTLINGGGGYDDMYVVKYSPSGNVLWAKSAGGNGYDLGQGISVDDFGNVYVAGSFNSTTIVFGNDTLTKTGVSDLFIVKYDASGNEIWAKGVGSAGGSSGLDIATDALGNAYVTGSFTGSSIVFGTTTVANSSSATLDVYVAKYSPSGNVIWAQGTGGPEHEFAHGISVSDSGNVCITGWFFSASFTFGPSIVTNFGNIFTSDIFVAAYSSAGTELWAKSAGRFDNDQGSDVSTDDSGNVYATGHFISTYVVFGTDTLRNSAGAGAELFVCKYSSSGTPLWAKKASGTGDDYGYGISADRFGNVYVAGWYDSPSLLFGGDSLLNSFSTRDDMFIAKYNSAGNLIWIKGARATPGDQCYAVSPDAFGNVYATGYFIGATYIMDSDTLLNSAPGVSDVFIARLDTASVTGLSVIKNSDFGFCVFPNPAGSLFFIRYSMPVNEKGSIRLFDMSGKLISSIDNNHFATGEHQISFSTEKMNAGIYFLRMETASRSETRKLIVIK